MDCSEILQLIDARRTCEVSEFGTRIATHCLYPGSDRVFVHVRASGDQFKVSDFGEAAQCGLTNGRDWRGIRKGLQQAATKFSLEQEGDALVASVQDSTWIPNAIAAVANAAALAASIAAEHSAMSQQKKLHDEIGVRLKEIVPAKLLAHEFSYVGRSGKQWQFDFAVTTPEPILVEPVKPHANSISAVYTAFADISANDNRRIAIFDKRPVNEDTALLRQVSELMPIVSMNSGFAAIVG